MSATFIGSVCSACVYVRETEGDLTQLSYNLSVTICLGEDTSFSSVSGFYIHKVGLTLR